MEFLLGYACFALESGNVTLALQLTESAERLAWGKERAVPNAGLFDKLRVNRVVHTGGPDSARPLVLECLQKYQHRHPFFYLDSIACGAWLDRLSLGRYTADSENGLALFDRLGARGCGLSLWRKESWCELDQRTQAGRLHKGGACARLVLRDY